VLRSGEIGYLPQDPRVGDPEVIARDRILSARGLDDVVRRLREAEVDMADPDPKVHERGMRRWSRADAELHAGGGYAAESEAAQMAAALGIEERILAQPIGTLRPATASRRSGSTPSAASRPGCRCSCS